MSALRSFFDGIRDGWQRKPPKAVQPRINVMKLPFADRPAPEHAEDEVCWCNPRVAQVDDGVWLIEHRRFEN